MKEILHSVDSITPMHCTFDECRDYTRNFAKSFYFSSFLLPKEKRAAAYAVYTFCRYADNIVDGSVMTSAENIREKFNELNSFLDEVYYTMERSRDSDDIRTALPNQLNRSAFAQTVIKYKIPRKYFHDLIEGVCMDTEHKRYNTFAELENYCYKVASVVGLIMTEIFGYTHKAALPYAVYLGKAMQLTNILRDIKEDYQMGRIYLPAEELKWFEYTEGDIAGLNMNENFAMMMRFNIDRARAYYELSTHGFPYLTNDGSRTTVVLMYKIYSRILNEIETYGYDVYSDRRFVSTAEKLKLTGLYLINRSERRKYSKLPDSKHHERLRSLYPNMNFDM
ncbi:MAG: phytoene/squalene synthase family protein [Ignavibacteria bacterium]|nr:phytoene/squalene synthase family protein [Ignavibacteria bacterium]